MRPNIRPITATFAWLTMRSFSLGARRIALSLTHSYTLPVWHLPPAIKMCSKSKVIRKIINTDKAPRPVAPYNQAVQVNNTVYVSGVLGLDKDTMKLVDGGTPAQARQMMVNLGHVLQAACSSYEKVVKTTIFLADIGDFAEVNNIYKEYFKDPYPARSAVQVGKLPLDAKVELEAIAIVGDIE